MTVDEFTMARDEKRLASVADGSLYAVMVLLLGEPPEGGWSAKARHLRRMVFAEIAARWIPPAVAFEALVELPEEFAGLDHPKGWT